MDTAVLLERLLQPTTTQFVEAMDTWRRDLPDPSLPTLLDFSRILSIRVGSGPPLTSTVRQSSPSI